MCQKFVASGMLHHVGSIGTDVSKECSVFIFMLKQSSNLKVEVLCSSETLVPFYQSMQR